MHDPGVEIEVIARGLAIREHKVLLCRSIKHGYSFLPGGHVEFGETSPQALSREFEEEAGIQVKVGGLVHIHEHIFRQGRRVRHELNVVFHVEHVPSDVQSREPKIAFDWVDLGDIPDRDLRPDAVLRLLSKTLPAGVTWESESLT